MTRARLALLLSTLSAGPLTAGLVWAHANGHESRTVADCEKLPGTEVAGERAQCLRCVQRPNPHHFHPDMPRGDRCHPNDGMPR